MKSKIILILITLWGVYACNRLPKERMELVVNFSGATIDSTVGANIVLPPSNKDKWQQPSSVLRYQEQEDGSMISIDIFPGKNKRTREERRRTHPADTLFMLPLLSYGFNEVEFDSISNEYTINSGTDDLTLRFLKDDHASFGCYVAITYNLRHALQKNKPDTLNIIAQLAIESYSDVQSEEHTYIPDTACLVLNSIPYPPCDTLRGYLYARKGRVCRNNDIIFSGHFKVGLQQYELDSLVASHYF